MKMFVYAVCAASMLFSVLFLTGCASYNVSMEALERSDRALEQAELANQRVDKLMEIYGGK